MIIIDFSQISYSCVLEHLASTKEKNASVDMCRHMILNTIRSNVHKFKRKYGEVVVAYDDKHYWRRDYFPHYKANRKTSRDKSQFNWETIFSCMDILKKEFQEHLMYKVLHVPKAEADDIIGTLVLHHPQTETVIVSGDKDFIQLQTNKNVSQWSPLLKKSIVEEFPVLALKQHIIRGDSGDGIPNILSPDDVFVSGGRQKPIMEKKLVGWLNMKEEDFCSVGDMLRNYNRNEQLIDLRHIPGTIQDQVLHSYATASHPNRMDFLNYLVSVKCKELVKVVDDF
jgi:hypothetical protein